MLTKEQAEAASAALAMRPAPAPWQEDRRRPWQLWTARVLLAIGMVCFALAYYVERKPISIVVLVSFLPALLLTVRRRPRSK